MAEMSPLGVKYWPAPAGALLGGLFDQALVGVALEVGVVAQPLVLVDEVLDELLQLGRGLDPVAGLAEDHAQHVVARSQLSEDLAVVGFERGSRPAQQRLPVVLDGHHPLAVQQLVLLVGHLQEQQVGELLQVVAVGQPVVAQHIAEVPQSLHERPGVVTSASSHATPQGACLPAIVFRESPTGRRLR